MIDADLDEAVWQAAWASHEGRAVEQKRRELQEVLEQLGSEERGGVIARTSAESAGPRAAPRLPMNAACGSERRSDRPIRSAKPAHGCEFGVFGPRSSEPELALSGREVCSETTLDELAEIVGPGEEQGEEGHPTHPRPRFGEES